MSIPEVIKPYSESFQEGSWRHYSLDQYGQWINLLMRRAFNRSNRRKMMKDIRDAKNYLAMLQASVEEQEKAWIDRFNTLQKENPEKFSD